MVKRSTQSISDSAERKPTRLSGRRPPEVPDRNRLSETGGLPLRPGDVIEVQALKAEGKAYRWWRARVESVDAVHISVVNLVGDIVQSTGRGWVYRHNFRTWYWLGRPYNLVEAYEPDGRLKQLYVHIASKPILEDRCLVYVDHELDVIQRTGRELRVADVDEFEEAAKKYGYSPDFQAMCWGAVDEAIELVRTWVPGEAPRRTKTIRLRPRRARRRRRSRR